MNGKGLMIGDWIYCKNDNKNHQVSSVNLQRDGSVLIAIEDDLYHDYMYDTIQLKRIHLTKNGFSAIDESDMVFIFNDGYEIRVEFDEDVTLENIDACIFLQIEFAEKELCMPIEYLHELQQAMRLFGIEKEIEL